MALGNKRRTVKGSDVLDGTRRRENLEFLGQDLQQFLSAFNKKLVKVVVIYSEVGLPNIVWCYLFLVRSCVV